MKTIVLISALLLGSSATSATFTAGDKRFVIQTVSYYADSAAAGPTTRVFIGTNIFDNVNFWALPTVYAEGTAYPSTTLSATYYAGAGATSVLNAYRTGDLSNTEYV